MYSVEAVCALADQNGLGQDLRAVLSSAQRHGLHARPWKNALMFCPPQERRRALFTCWAAPRQGDFLVWVGPQVFADYFPITAEQAVADLGAEGYRELPNGVAPFINDLDRLFGHIAQAQAAAESPVSTAYDDLARSDSQSSEPLP